jgi:hypothetical protein
MVKFFIESLACDELAPDQERPVPQVRGDDAAPVPGDGDAERPAPMRLIWTGRALTSRRLRYACGGFHMFSDLPVMAED